MKHTLHTKVCVEHEDTSPWQSTRYGLQTMIKNTDMECTLSAGFHRGKLDLCGCSSQVLVFIVLCNKNKSNVNIAVHKIYSCNKILLYFFTCRKCSQLILMPFLTYDD